MTLFINIDLKANSTGELYRGLLIAKERIENLKKEKALLEKERNELLLSYEASLERAIYLEDKIEGLAEELKKWMEKYDKLLQQCERKGFDFTPYIKIGGSDKHIKGAVGLDVRITKNFVFYGEAYGKYYDLDKDPQKGLFWEAGIKYEFR